MKSRLLLVLVIAALLLSLVAAACTTEEEAEGPIKIGALLGLTGFISSDEHHVRNGIELAFDEVDYEIAGREVKLIIEDIGSDTAICLEKVKKLNEMDNVNLVLGPYLSSHALAIRDYIHDNELITISHLAATEKLVTEEAYSDYFFRTAHCSGYQPAAVAAYIAYYDKGYRKAVAFAPDYVYGWDEVAGFKRVFEGLGGEVIMETYTPLGNADFGPYMATIDVENADFITTCLFAEDSVLFIKALEDYGILDKLPVFCHECCVVEYPQLAAQGDSAIGIEDACHYSPVLDTPENNRFKQAIWDKFQEEANFYTESGYTAAKAAILAIEAVDGNIEDTEAMIEALENLEFEAPRGPLRFELHSPVQNVYHRIVEKVDGKLQNTVLATYPDIGPLWGPEELQ